MNYAPHFSAYPEYDSNPFSAEGLSERWIERERGHKVVSLVVAETGEVIPYAPVPKKIKVTHDPTVYTKVFTKDMEVVDGLCCAAKCILLYLVYKCRPKGAEMELNVRAVSKWCGISKTSYYTGIRDLLDKDVVALRHRARQMYWINPNYVFNGNRAKVK